MKPETREAVIALAAQDYPDSLSDVGFVVITETPEGRRLNEPLSILAKALLEIDGATLNTTGYSLCDICNSPLKNLDDAILNPHKHELVCYECGSRLGWIEAAPDANIKCALCGEVGLRDSPHDCPARKGPADG